jgi:hypothetical protein
MALQPLTELEAVNIILSSVGEDPEALLNEVSREIQERGWHFNTENDYEFSIDADGYVTLPANVAQFDLPRGDSRDVVMRGRRLYDRTNRTYEFSGETITGTVIWLLEWDELPPAARRYFAMEAAHRYQKRWFGSETLVGFTQDDLRKAQRLFISQESLQADYTIFDNYDVARTLDRKSGSEFI